MTENNVRPLTFLDNGGKMGKLMREKDWSKTPVGTPDTWPQSLRTAVNLVLNSRFPMFIWWGKDLTTFYNDAYRIIAGEKHPALLGTSGRVGWAEIWKDLSPLVDSVFNGQSTWSEDQLLYINRRGHIEETYFTFSYSPVVDESGTINGLFCAVIETTEKVLATRKIQQSENNLRATILQSPVAMCILKGPSFIVEIANNRMYELWGRGADDLLHRPIFDGLPEARDQGLEALLQKVMTLGESFTASELLVHLPRNGKVEALYLNFVYEPFRESDGTITGVIAIGTDVTEQVLTRHRIEESEARFRMLADQAPMIVYMVEPDAEARMSYFNTTWLNYTGQHFEEALGRAWDGIVHPDDLQGIFDNYVPAFQKKEPYTLPAVRLKRHDGQYRWHYFKGTPRYLPTGEFMGYIGVGIDIHEQKLAAEALEQSEARARAAIDIARLGTFEIDVEKQTILHSPRTAEILGLDTAKQWPYQTFIDSVHPDDNNIRIKALETALQTGVLFYEVRLMLPGQNINWVRLNGRYIQRDGKPIIIGTLMDITDEKKAAEILEQKVEDRTRELRQVNEQLKQFTYAASHDLQEPLRKIGFFIDRLFVNLGPTLSEDNKRITERIQKTAARMRSLIDDLLTYSNTSLGVTGFEEVDLNASIQEVLEDMEATILEKGAHVHVQDLPKVMGDRRQLRQLFQNIIGNGLKYNKKGIPPHVNITAKRIQGSDTEAEIPEERGSELFYLIEVTDNGIGFDSDDAERIFRLFQRLHGKAEYEGTGVGLAIVQQVAENHKGFVWAESTPGSGSTFKILLPISEP